MMKNKVWLLGGMGIAIVTAIMVWACWSEYGEGYSEEQRRNWNEMVAKTSDNEDYLGVIINSTSCDCSSVLTERQTRSDAPPWSLMFSKESVALPLEGMSFPELIHLADKGDRDGNACLELVFRYFKGSWLKGKSPGQVFVAEKYLKKAVALGRLGADFLLCCLEEWKKYGVELQGENVKGYRDFLFHLDEGDFFLGKIYCSLFSDDDGGLERLVAGLDKKVACGDIVAMRNRGYLELLKRSTDEEYHWVHTFETQRANDLSWVNAILEDTEDSVNLLPDCLKPKEETIKGLRRGVYSLVSSWYTKRDLDRLKAPLCLLMVAAERGDLHAKYLWSQYFVWSGMKFSQKEWENHLRYTTELVNAGWHYVGQGVLDSYMGAFPVESVFYEKRSVEEAIDMMEQRQEKGCALLFPNAAGDYELLRMEAEAQYNMGAFVDNYIIDVSIDSVEKTKLRMRGLQLIEQAAEAGNPYALYGLSVLLHEGMSVEQDVRKSWKLLQHLKSWREGMCFEEGLVGDVILCLDKSDGAISASDTAFFDTALELQMVNVVSRHGDMPGMTVKDAFDRFVEVKGFGTPIPREVQDQLGEQFEKRGYKVPDENTK